MPRYRIKPVEIKAFQLNGDGPTPTPEWFGIANIKEFREDGLLLYTTVNNCYAGWNYYIVNDGEDIYAIDPKTFEQTYDLIS